MNRGKLIPVDCHMHTPLCGHAYGNPEEYVATAAERGIELITFTCHCPMLYPKVFREEGIRMKPEEFGRYRELVDRARAYGASIGVEVRFGIEAEVFPQEDLLEEMQEFLEAEPFDFVLGSLHHQLPGFHAWVEVEGLEEDVDIIAAYFEALGRGAETGIYDSLSHPDLIRIYGTVEPFDPADHAGVIQRFLDRVARAGVCLEVNTSGLFKGVFEIHPDPLVVGWAFERGIPFTIGSDSHLPEQVGQGFDRAAEVLWSAGYREVNCFRGRDRFAVPIPEPAPVEV